MSPLRRHRWISGAIALVVAFAWLLASNHCVIAAAKSSAHACCHEKPPGKSSAPVSTECCEAFNVPVPEHVSAPAADLHAVMPAWIAADELRLLVDEPARFHAFAHAPPRAGTQLEIVLTRCVPAHAPPSFVV